MTVPTPGSTGGVRGAGRERPPPGMVAAAEQECHDTSEQLDEFTTRVQALFDQKWEDLEVVTDVYRTLRTQQGREATLLSAIAIVRLAQSAQAQEHIPGSPQLRTAPRAAPFAAPHPRRPSRGNTSPRRPANE